MNKDILKTGIQEFIEKNLNTDISSLLLKKPFFDTVTNAELAEQLEAKNKCKQKLPLWYNTPNIYYPNKLNIEQTSSEETAQYKASLVQGKSLIDLTGGYGIDAYYFSKKIDTVTHVELQTSLSEIAAYNSKILERKNLLFENNNSTEFLTKITNKYDWIYIDPSRRNDAKGKVFLLSDCLPDVTKHLDLFFEKTENILIKTSPILDINNAILELKNIKEIHVVALQNEVKEVLYILAKNYTQKPVVHTVNITPKNNEIFSFNLDEEATAISQFSEPLKYLFEPNSAILKSGCFKLLGANLELQKLHQHSHLYTSKNKVDFPGRSFKIEAVLPFQKSVLKKKLQGIKANITSRNFPLKVEDFKKKFKIKDGGDTYIFLTTNCKNEKIIIFCSKLETELN